MSRRQAVSLLIVLCLMLFAPVTLAQEKLVVAPGGVYTTIEDALNDAQSGDTIEVHGGVYPAPLLIEKSIALIGINDPVIDGGGTGSLVNIIAPDVHFEGFTVRNSGENLNREDTGIVVQAANVTIINNTVENVLFGIYFANASNGLAQNNKVRCYPRDVGLRGDGMRAWYSSDLVMDSNDISECRDTLVWYAENVVITNNSFKNSRYGLHFMYSSNGHIANNLIEGNSVGTYLMYSQHLTMRDNVMSDNRGPSGYGIALKDIDYATIEGNALINNRSGLYIDGSPSLVDVTNTYSENLIAYNEIGLSALPSTARNVFTGNIFLENNQQVSVLGRGNLLNNTWSTDEQGGNYWSDYAGYDGDGDGIGDMDYRSEKLFESLTDAYPATKLFAYSPASQAIEFAASAFPSLRPDPKVIDHAPMLRYTLPTDFTQASQPFTPPFLLTSLFLAGLGVGICLYAVRNPLRRRVFQKKQVLTPAQTGS